MMRRNWLPLSLALICGLALGSGAFTLVHKWEPGFTNFTPAGVMIFEDPIHTILHAQLGGFALCFGAMVFAFGVVLLLSRRVVTFGRQAGFLIAVLGMMLVSQAGLQLRFDSIYPSAAAVDQLARECKESGRQPCMTVPLGDK